MREVTADRFVPERPAAIARVLTPERIVEWEGSFSVEDVEKMTEDTAVVTVSGPGMGFRLRFERLPNGYRFAVPEEVVAGPFEHMETWLTVDAENEGSRVQARSIVALNLPLPFADRIAAWKRRGELRRTLAGLADAV